MPINIDKPSKYFDTKLYTGTGSSQSINGLEFSPNMVWIKNRSSATSHQLFDSVRGVQKALFTNGTDAEETNANFLTAFNSDGFTVGTSSGINGSGNSIVAWNWLAGGTGVSNTAGSITSTVSANTTSGFSVGKTTGTLSSGTITVGHGLGVAPSMILWKRTDGTSNWQVYHKSTGTNLMQLNTTGAVVSGSYWGTMSSTTFTVSNSLYGSGETYAFYCFAEVKGYSKFSSYTGNSNADGTFVYTGFKPAFIMVKATGGTEGWVMLDNKRANTFNAVNGRLRANVADAEETNVVVCDFVSNGFKFRFSDGAWNSSSYTYIYMAFSESPFVSSKGIACTAR